MGHCLVPWHFPVFIEPLASLLLGDYKPYDLTRIHSFLFFLLTAFLLIDYDRLTDRQTDSTVTFNLREVVPSHIFYGIPRGDDGKLSRLEA